MALDLAAAGWAPNVENYLGRVTKARILEAVREAKGEQAAQRLEGLKKPDMAEAAAQALAGTGWLPEPLRTKGVQSFVAVTDQVEGAGKFSEPDDEHVRSNEPPTVERSAELSAELPDIAAE